MEKDGKGWKRSRIRNEKLPGAALILVCAGLFHVVFTCAGHFDADILVFWSGQPNSTGNVNFASWIIRSLYIGVMDQLNYAMVKQLVRDESLTSPNQFHDSCS